jgi:glycerol-3-phosphate acyltransferase PlsX
MDECRIAVDAMGGDFAPAAIVEGAMAAARDHNIAVTLVGVEPEIRRELARHGTIPANLRIAHAPQVIAMEEHATAALRHKQDSSVAVGVRLVKNGEAGAFVSAGNTGATMAIATLTLGRLPGVDRPALGTVFPSERGRFLLLDVGANADSKPAYLVQFAGLGRAYVQKVMGIPNPKLGLLNIGEEAGKGSEFAREVFERLSEIPDLNFIGNVEGKDLPCGVADVVVTDGFTGNVVIKTAEGTAEFILRELRAALTSRLHYKLAALILRPALMAVRAKIDYAEYGGAPLLGLNGAVFVSHGRSNARAIASAVRVAHTAVVNQPDRQRSLSRAIGSGDAS